MPTLEWIGKDKVINHHLDVPYQVLEEKYTFNKETPSENKIIKGDNLAALKSLLPEYEGKIKCIYIDPPYNTGKEGWCYNDSVNDPKIKKWLGQVVGKEGEDLSRHDKWLCMMYPRLKLLHKLLSDDGAIFISIDDNEQANLKIICDEIFGKNNFLSQFTWKTDGNFDNQAKVKICHEYILCYLKNPIILGLPNGIDPSIPQTSKIFKDYIRNTLVKNGINNPMSEIVLPKGFPSSVEQLEIDKREDAFPYYLNKAIIRDYKLTNDTIVKSGWSSKDILISFIENNLSPVTDTKGQETTFEITSTGNIEMIKKRNQISHVISVLTGFGSTQNMSNELKKMKINFDYPKPVTLIEYFIGFYCDKNSIILDSFAGSGTTAHAVLNLNKQDGGNRKFILVEMEDYAEDTTAERVRRVIKGYSDVEGTGGDFTFCELGERLLDENGNLNETVSTEKIRNYIWYMETHTKLPEKIDESKYYLGTNADTAYYFAYEKDRLTELNYDLLSKLKTKADNYVIYADTCTLSESELLRYSISFRKIPRDIAKL